MEFGAAGAPGRIGNMSLRGIYFNTKTPLCEGEIVEVLLKMPEEVSGEQTTEWRCTGHVVRVEPFDPAKGQLGIGVQFYCNEAARPEQARSEERRVGKEGRSRGARSEGVE